MAGRSAFRHGGGKSVAGHPRRRHPLTRELVFVEQHAPAPADLRGLVATLDDAPTIDALIALGSTQGGWQRRQVVVGVLDATARAAERLRVAVDELSGLRQYLLRSRAAVSLSTAPLMGTAAQRRMVYLPSARQATRDKAVI